MAVAFTTNIVLAKPDNNEIAENWVNTTELAEDNNLIIADKTDINLTLYVPSIIGSTTNPNVGAGAAHGEYYEVQGWIFGSVEVLFLSPGIVVGTGAGAYGISLPVLPDTTFHSVGTTLSDTNGVPSCIGDGHIIDNTVANGGTVAVDIVIVGGVAYARMLTETYSGKASVFVTPGAPVTIDTNDRWSINFVYKKA